MSYKRGKKKKNNLLGVTLKQFQENGLGSEYMFRGYRVISATYPGKDWFHTIIDKDDNDVGAIQFKHGVQDDGKCHFKAKFNTQEALDEFSTEVIHKLQQKGMAKTMLNQKKWYEMNPLSYFFTLIMSNIYR